MLADLDDYPHGGPVVDPQQLRAELDGLDKPSKVSRFPIPPEELPTPPPFTSAIPPEELPTPFTFFTSRDPPRGAATSLPFPSPSPYTMGIVLESKDESIEVSRSLAKTLSVGIPLTPVLSMYPSSHWYEDSHSHLHQHPRFRNLFP